MTTGQTPHIPGQTPPGHNQYASPEAEAVASLSWMAERIIDEKGQVPKHPYETTRYPLGNDDKIKIAYSREMNAYLARIKRDDGTVEYQYDSIWFGWCDNYVLQDPSTGQVMISQRAHQTKGRYETTWADGGDIVAETTWIDPDTLDLKRDNLANHGFRGRRSLNLTDPNKFDDLGAFMNGLTRAFGVKNEGPKPPRAANPQTPRALGGAAAAGTQPRHQTNPNTQGQTTPSSGSRFAGLLGHPPIRRRP